MSRRKQARPSRANLEEELVQGSLRNNPVGTPEDEARKSIMSWTKVHDFLILFFFVRFIAR